MNTVLFVNATIVFSVNLFLVAESRPPTIPRIFIFPFKIMYIICDYLTDTGISPKVPVEAMPHGSDFYNEFAKIHQIYEKSYRAMEFSTKSL